MSERPIHVKPSFYANCFYGMKQIAMKYGYALMLHGSLSRDMDLVAIPWIHKAKPHEKMIRAIAHFIGGKPQMYDKKKMLATVKPHGRLGYVIDLARLDKEYFDRQWYLDISVMLSEREKQ